MQQQRSILIIFLATFLLWIGWMQVRHLVLPTPPPPPVAEKVTSPTTPTPADSKPSAAPLRIPGLPDATPNEELVTLGSRERQSDFDLEVRLDPLGGSVRSVILNKFQAGDAEGRPEWQTDEDGKLVLDEKGRKVPKVLSLVPDDPRQPSYQFLAYSTKDTLDQKPLDTLSRVRWEVVKKDGQAVQEDTVERDGKEKKRQQVSFSAVVDDVRITRTYSLVEGEYHLGMEVKLERLKGDPLKFRYQLTGAHNLPVEGKWYTYTFRNALLAQEDRRGYVYRDLQELRQIAQWEGGNSVVKQAGTNPDGLDERFIRYAGVAVQYFASVIVVDKDQKDQAFLSRARPTLERAAVRGVVKSKGERDPNRGGTFVLARDGDKVEMTFQVRAADRMQWASIQEGQRVAVIYQTAPADSDNKHARVVLDVRIGQEVEQTHPLWEDDITVRVTTEPIELKVGEPVVQKYLLYNGPVKVSQLLYLEGSRQVSRPLIDRYLNDLHLNTLTDYHTPGWFGEFLSSIYWTSLVIHCTNLMHWVLGLIHYVVPSYGLCIILLTVLVRGLMFPISRRQALMGIKMQELAPEMKKLAEKYPDDPQARQMAQMELFRKHGVNPLGSCWFMLLQMPIMMGLYYALQESILFRLGSFWPTWITNLAAPDMLLYWGKSIPWISRPEDYGGFLYLGPYLNLLPIIAVTLMIVQQQMYTPPPTDEQQEVQQKMMKYMMIFFGLMFYKVAAGLTVYFIASSLWGFAERRLLPKKKEQDTGAPSDRTSAPVTNSLPFATAGASTEAGRVTTSAKGRNKPGRKRKGERTPVRPETPGTPNKVGELRERLSNWWNDLLEKARKK